MHSFAVLIEFEQNLQWLQVENVVDDRVAGEFQSFGSPVEFPFDEVLDWMFIHNNRLIGGFTFREAPEDFGWSWPDVNFYFAVFSEEQRNDLTCQLLDAIGNYEHDRFLQIARQSDRVLSQTREVAVEREGCGITVGPLSPFLYAICLQNVKVIDYILGEGFVDRTRDRYDWNALHLASYQPNALEIVSKLIEAGFGVNEATETGVTSLGIAIVHNNVPLMRLLVSAGARVNYCEKFVIETHRPPANVSPVLDAKEIESLEYLLSLGVDCNVSGFNGQTPLHIAILLKRYLNAILLLKHGADPDAVDSEGLKPDHDLHFHENSDNPLLKELLELFEIRRMEINSRPSGR